MMTDPSDEMSTIRPEAKYVSPAPTADGRTYVSLLLQKSRSRRTTVSQGYPYEPYVRQRFAADCSSSHPQPGKRRTLIVTSP